MFIFRGLKKFITLFITIPTLILQNLADDLKSEFSGKIEEAIVSLMMLPESYDAVSLHDAMSVSFFILAIPVHCNHGFHIR